MIARIRHRILKIAYPLIQWANDVHLPFTRKKLSEKHLRQIKGVIQPGDLILTAQRGELTNILIGGRYKHVGVYSPCIKKGHWRCVIEAIDPVVVEKGLCDFILKKDRVCIVRPKMSLDLRHEAAKKARQCIGSYYDYEFHIPTNDEVNKAFYCSELAYWVYKQVNPNWGFCLNEILGVPTIKPDEYYSAREFFDIIYESE